ncbi:MAG TPA: trypsin-like peptidase domain-containing protein [Candidatus Acidoferrales bacterium]|nr:trypsin-like peptidase domain-containing protein [Candidatus Acidoferrales bacterium]
MKLQAVAGEIEAHSSMPSHASKKLSEYRRIIAVLLLVIALLGAVAIYYSPLLSVPSPTGIAHATGLTPVQIYANSNQSVVTIQGVVQDESSPNASLSSILGTGFIITYVGSYYIVTNFHVMNGLQDATVTFSDGNSYPAKVVGLDAYSDLAIVSVNAKPSELRPLTLGSSSALKVGESVVAIGNPYGLSNTITVGIVSQVGRALQEDTLSGFAVPDTIQFSAAVNPGNSGGPLINSEGLVVGITTATVTNSVGLGFAIPADTITRELPSLIHDGSYDKHPYLGVQLIDMSYQLSQAMGTNVTYGVLIVNVVPGGPASISGLRGGSRNATIEQQQYMIGGDIIISVNGNRITNYDSFAAFLEEHAAAGQTVKLGIVRNGQFMVIQVLLGSKPPLT